MNDVTTTIKFDRQLKADGQALAETLGMSFGTLVKVLLKQAVRKRGIQLDTREEIYPAEQMTPAMEQAIGEVETELQAGTLETVSHNEFLASLDNTVLHLRNTPR